MYFFYVRYRISKLGSRLIQAHKAPILKCFVFILRHKYTSIYFFTLLDLIESYKKKVERQKIASCGIGENWLQKCSILDFFQILPFLNIYKYVNNGLKPLYFPLINPSVGILSDEYNILTQYFHIFVIFTLKIKKKNISFK